MPKKAIISLVRPINSVMVGFAVIVGVAISSPTEIIRFSTFIGFLTGFFISGFSMIINDYYDLEVDRINQPERPLASGKITLRMALFLALTFLIFGVITSLIISINNFIIASVFALIAWLYSYWGKKKVILGNIMVALSISIPYLYGGMVVENGIKPILLWLTLVTFLAAMGREVIKTISDVAGDEIRKIRSVARVYGIKKASLIGSMMFILALIFSWFPFLLGIAGIKYALLILVPNVIFIYAIIRIIVEPSINNALYIKKVALFGMFMGLLVFLLGGIANF